MAVPFQDKLPNKIPLLLVLVTPFVALTVLAVGLVGYLSFRNGQRAVNDVAHQLRTEITHRIEEHLYTFLDVPQQINQTNANLLRQGVLTADNAPALEHHFWQQVQIFDSVSSIYLGNTQGGLVNAGREGADGFLYIIATDGFVHGPFKKYATDSQGQRTDLLVTVPAFDARTRLWYTGAVAKDEMAWSEAYILFTGQDMAIAASQPVYDEQGTLLGVVSVDLFLSQLSNFLQNLEVGKTGHAFIMERSGLLVASSATEDLFVTEEDDNIQRRLYATESTVPLIRQAAIALSEQVEGYTHLTGRHYLEFDWDGTRQFLQVSSIRNEKGLDWLVVVVLPEADFMGQIEANNRFTAFLTIITLVIAIVVSIFTTRKIIRPISDLNHTAMSLARGTWERTIQHDSRIDEISRLTYAFNQMAEQIQHMVTELTIEVAERKHAEAALKEQEESLRTTLNSIGDAVITTDTKGQVTGMNPVAETLTGWQEKDAQQKLLATVFNIVNEQTRKPIENPVEKVLKADKVIGLANHTVLIARDGREYHIADSGAPIRDASRRITGVVLVFRDVTEQLRAEQEMLKIKKLESLGILAGGIAHDFNNLLVGLFGNLEMAKIQLSAEHKSYKYLESAERAMERATNLTKQLLTFAKGGTPIKKRLSLGRVITETATFSIRGTNNRLQMNLAPNLWPVEADRGQLGQVITNLVINAQQAMPVGGTITIAAENVETSTGKYVKLTVQDEGVGIAPQHLDKIFDPYFSTKQSGSGLGLATTYSIISKHDGSITVDSQLNQGTIFTIYLPTITREGKRGKGTAPLSMPNPINPASSAQILVVDDEEMVRDVVGAMLKKMGHQVVFAANGQEAITKYQAAYKNGHAYDVVITDLTMPGRIGGREVAQGILAINPQAKLIVSSGYATNPVMASYQAYGFKGRVEKPHRFADLQTVLEQVLE